MPVMKLNSKGAWNYKPVPYFFYTSNIKLMEFYLKEVQTLFSFYSGKLSLTLIVMKT